MHTETELKTVTSGKETLKYPDVPELIKSGGQLKIIHTFENSGIGKQCQPLIARPLVVMYNTVLYVVVHVHVKRENRFPLYLRRRL